MIFKFLNKSKEKPDTSAEAVNIACLLVHAAKIDENYTSDEKEIIKKTVKKLYPDLDNLDDVITQAEQKENDSNHIQEFTKDVKSLSTENKILIVETLWRIILSDGKSDIYENNLMRRLAGLLYLDDIDKVIEQAERKENDSNHIQEFTRDVKSLSTENKIIIVETLWRIILSDGNSDIYENNLMRRLAGLLYLDDKIVGETKVKILNNK